MLVGLFKVLVNVVHIYVSHCSLYPVPFCPIIIVTLLYYVFVCTDINECTSGTHNCTRLQMCENTAGSFICSCITGYRPSMTSPLRCEGKPL